ncbi:MAG: HAMP domain-containing protein [Pseudomonadales bacterium]|nr:HAMP domain-containing protein [Pseudomonadales bacterium]
MVSVFTLALLWSIIAANLESLLLELSDTFGQTLSTQTANSAAELVLAEDLLSLNVIVTKVAEAPMISRATIYDADWKVLVQSGEDDIEGLPFEPLESSSSEQGIYISPITFQDVQAGYALVVLDKQIITSRIQESLQWMAIATLSILAISILVALVLGKHITDPVKMLTAALSEIREGHLDYRIEEERFDELGGLIDGFNEMAQGLKERQQMRETFNRYVAPNIADNILANLDTPSIATEYVNASVLFVDIVGFTQMCEGLEPEAVGDLLNTYYHYTLEASTFYNGTVDKFIGDGAMILFGTPEEDPEHAFHAICCAQLFLGLVDSFNSRRQENNLPIIQFRLGLHCGEMLAGTLGTNERLQYTVVGDAVNIASRLCNQGYPGKLVISESVYRHAGGHFRLVTQDQLSLNVRGKSANVPIYIVEDVQDQYSALIANQVKQIETAMHTDRSPPTHYKQTRPPHELA